MLSAFFGELGKRLVDKWLTLLYFPGCSSPVPPEWR